MRAQTLTAAGFGLLVAIAALDASATIPADMSEQRKKMREENAARRAQKVAECLECHGEEEAGEVTFADGSALQVGVDGETWSQSIHGGRLTCTQCHRSIGDYPHAEVRAMSARDYQLSSGAVCKKCHLAYYKRAQDGIHAEELRKGNDKAPSCVDCHGAHDTKDADQPRADINVRCSRCHDDVATAYARSIHGKALNEEGSADVPVCTDCHGAHAISDPREAQAKASSHDLCAPCHSDAERMKKYGLSTDVLTSYVEDFHDASNVLYALGSSKAGKPMITCVDCHGTHEIVSLKDPESSDAMREQLTEVCRECHKDATPTFADAWLPHYQPTLQSAPLVWGIKWTYRIMIPTIMLGLVLHILLHLLRLRTHR